jgi:hypothetical protein
MRDCQMGQNASWRVSTIYSFLQIEIVRYLYLCLSKIYKIAISKIIFKCKIYYRVCFMKIFLHVTLRHLLTKRKKQGASRLKFKASKVISILSRTSSHT